MKRFTVGIVGFGFIGVDMTEALDIQHALAAYQGIAQITFQNRFFPATLRAKQLIDEGFLGRVLEFRAQYLHSGSADPDTPLRWKLSAASGGGVIANLGSHVLDLMHHLLGDLQAILASTCIAYPERPSASDPRIRVAVDAEDNVQMLVHLASGATGIIEASKLATGTEDELRFEIHGSRGALRFNSTAPHYLEAYDAGAAGLPLGGRKGWQRIDAGQRYAQPAGFPGPKFSIGWIRTHMACPAHFLSSVAQGAPADPGLEQGLYVQRLLECARASARTRTWVQV